MDRSSVSPLQGLQSFHVPDPGFAPWVFLVCRACSTAWRCKSSTQPDGGEELAKRKGVAARWGLKEARSKSASR